MINLTNRLSARNPVTPGGVNAIVSEIQAVLNRIGIVRYSISDPKTDYFRFDNDTKSLYLETIEGETYEVTLG